MNNRFAPGRRAWGECARSGRRMLLKDMTFDGYYPNLRVDPAWREERHPQEQLPKVTDAIALHQPAPPNLPQPSTPVLEGELAGGPRVEIEWSESTSSVELITQYVIFRAVGADSDEFDELATVPVTRDAFAAITSSREYEDDSVQSGNTYRYYVIARGVKGRESAPSNIVQISVG